VTTATRRRGPLVAAAVALLLILALLAIFWPRGEKTKVTAYFPSTVALFDNSDVRILGIRVGKVTDIVPQGKTVRVDMEVDGEHKLPASLNAAIVSPNIVADRFVQLTPPYRGGAQFRSGGVIPVDRTATPVELDRVYSSLNDLNVALGPQGANKDGALSDLLEVGANNLDGQGENLNATVEGLADTFGTLSDGREDLFGTIKNLQTFSTALAQNDSQVRSFNRNLAGVADQLAGEREELSAALKNLAVALAEVNTFVRDNKALLAENVADLAEVSGVLARQKKALEEVMEKGPLGLSNLVHAYDHTIQGLSLRDNQSQGLHDPALYVCTVLKKAKLPEAGPTCKLIEDTLGLPLLDGLLPSPGRAALQPATRDLTLGGILEAKR
jgi:phospholipid/cholesterol/gamma-HCH transport system substrate-binding protein